MTSLRTNTTRAGPTAPPVVHDVLRSPGRRLDAGARAYLEPRLGHDFSDVRVHSDARAAASARAVDAAAYAVGRDVVLGEKATPTGRLGLLAHELAHVAQGGGAPTTADEPLPIGPRDDAHEREAARAASSLGRATPTIHGAAPGRVLRRADPADVGQTMERGRIAGSGFQLWPVEVTSSEVGPPAQGIRFTGSPANALSAIVGDGLTFHRLAAQLRPLWTTAASNFDDDTGTILDPEPVDAMTLARAIAFFNAPALGLPDLSRWRSGFRVVLPVEVDVDRQTAIVYPQLLRRLASAFPNAWVGVLGAPTRLTIQPTAPVLEQQAADFLAANPTTVEQGSALATQALANASASYLLVQEVFRRLGPDAFAVALQFVESLGQQEVNTIASQDDGATILAEVSRVLSTRPGELLPTEEAALGRATGKLLERLSVPTRRTPGRACELGPARDVSIQPIFFRDDARDRKPTGGSFSDRMDVARQVWAKVGVSMRTETPIVLDDTTSKRRGTTDAEIGTVLNLRTGAGLEVFVVDNDLPTAGGGASRSALAATGGSKVIVSDRGTSKTLLAHELGHAMGLKHPGDGTARDGDAGTIMEPTSSHSVEQPRRNTARNGLRLAWPSSGLGCIRPDP